jgi:HAD superfamily hydrolase (TIGR01509 family)
MFTAGSYLDFSLTVPPGDFEAFIFDCDGTLIDSMPLHWHAWRAALTTHGAPFEFTLEMHHAFAGMSIREIVGRLNERYGTSLDGVAVEKTRAEWFYEHLPELQPVTPVVAVAEAWKNRIKLAVASGSERGVVRRELEHLGLWNHFGACVTPEDVARSKPFPDLFLRAAELIGVRPEKCLVFEDGKNGIKAAEAAGMHWVYVPTNEAPGTLVSSSLD